ncbi:unnamed protein product [Urochloa decumbens]|uniref:Glycosyltransferase N-terminal domain-containing protein n=1 Tax=Urochloa decumbens TaxID=240449 RepID=A0ABC9DAE0_9POAL
MGSETASERRVHAVCMPYPAQGHVTPMLKLAKLLHARGFHVTFVNTEFNHRRLLRSRGAASLASVPEYAPTCSTLESMCSGVPMLSWPFFAEQQTNCRYKRTEWGVGVEIGGEVRRDEVAAIIKEAMEGEKGNQMRQCAEEWKVKAVEAARPGGPAETNLNRVIDEVLLSNKM